MKTPQLIQANSTLRKLSTVSLAALVSSIAPAFAEDSTWKENFAACAGNSPFIESLLNEHNQEHRPLMKIGDMQAWAIRDQNGEHKVALTTSDGLTIIGQINGPQGEDISAALLATVPNKASISLVDKVATSNAQPIATITSQSTRSGPQIFQSNSKMSSKAARPETTAAGVENLEVKAPLTAPITAAIAPTPEQQRGMDLIFQQATEERVWFSATNPNEGAPVVYMLADPECPHCQWTIDQMYSQLNTGEIDLRIIFTPITGVQGFNTSLSILHTDNVAKNFMSHMTSKTRGTTAITQMDTSQADRKVVQGIADNINWMRGNGMPGVPFFLYKTNEGTRFAFSELPANILTEAKPL